MDRFNLWVTTDHSKIICYGSQCDMNSIALTARLPGNVHVLPDGHEPNQPATLPPCKPL